MKNKNQKRFISGEERALRFNLYHNGLFKQKIIPNKKKAERKREKIKLLTSVKQIFINRFPK